MAYAVAILLKTIHLAQTCSKITFNVGRYCYSYIYSFVLLSVIAAHHDKRYVAHDEKRLCMAGADSIRS